MDIGKGEFFYDTYYFFVFYIGKELISIISLSERCVSGLGGKGCDGKQGEEDKGPVPVHISLWEREASS